MEIMEDINYGKKRMGRKIAKIRDFMGIKQEALALKLGVTQQSISKMEQEDELPDEKLKEVADALGISPEAIKNFDEEKIFFYINNVEDHSVGVVNGDYHNNNPVDKLIEVYERLLASEREKIELLKNLNKH